MEDKEIKLEKENISIEEKINNIKEDEKFKLKKQYNLDEMIELENKTKVNRIESLNKMLDEEISYIYSKIDSSNRKWILDDFRNYLYNHRDGYVCARIYSHRDAKELKKILKKFKNDSEDRNIKLAIADRLDYRSVKIDKDLDREKVITLLKSWIFYSNTTVDYRRTTAFPTDFNKSALYKVKVSALVVIGVTISIAACAALLTTVFVASESEAGGAGGFGFDEIFFFGFMGGRNNRDDRRGYNYDRRRKKTGVAGWFNNLKESWLY